MYLPNEIRGAKVLITVKTYPLPSNKYEELVCTAGLLENGKWIRIYPIPFRSLPYGKRFSKFQWIQLDLIRNSSKDFRPESYRPIGDTANSIILLDYLNPKIKGNWKKRKEIVLKEVYTNFIDLISAAYSEDHKSLATIKPLEIIDLEIEEDSRDWKQQWLDYYGQYDLFNFDKTGESKLKEKLLKVPYKYYYKFLTEGDNKPRRIMIEDWEIGALYWNSLNSTDGDEVGANELVKKRYLEDFTTNRDLYLFVGTTLQFHRRKAPNPFVIIGVFYPPKEKEITPSLFDIL
jgi:hypothetical protein